MKKIALLLTLSCLAIGLNAQNILGAWESYSITESGDSVRSVVIFSDGYQALTMYSVSTGAFIHTNGGTWKLEGDMMTEKVEFHTDIAQRVGTEVTFQVIIADETIEIVGSKMILTRIDNGLPGELQGAWLMSGRVKDNETQLRDTSKPRKTMKLLSGTRFQWIAYNTETKEFKGTGGGTYTTINGEYTENIEFFSKDDSKVGRSLTFDFELIYDQWHHSGLSSKEDPIHEIWSAR